MGKIKGSYPVYLPSRSALSEKIIMLSHKKNLHVGVTSTMAKVRTLFWIPVMRKLTEFVMQNCYSCKPFHTTSYTNSKPAFLQRDITAQDLG